METKKLTPKDIMIGDWVLWKNKPVQIAAVSGIKYSFGQIDVTLAYCNDEKVLESHDIKTISPIPLTAEVLEKNGWYIPKNSSWWQNNEVDFYIVGYTDGLFEIYTDGDSKFSCLCCIGDVHELQHLYHICHIDKEIVL